MEIRAAHCMTINISGGDANTMKLCNYREVVTINYQFLGGMLEGNSKVLFNILYSSKSRLILSVNGLEKL